MTTTNPARPCSSPARPTAGDDHTLAGRPSLSPPPGTTSQRTSTDDHQKTTSSSHPNGTTWNPGTTWLITPTTYPAWDALSAQQVADR